MKICIVGAGAAGLAALRHSLAQGHECIAFEQSDKIGGTWNYTDRTHLDEYGLPVHSSMYQGLKTNLPKEVMEFEDFPYEEKGRSFIDQPDVMEYMIKFATHFNLYPHIKNIHSVSCYGMKIHAKRIRSKCVRINIPTQERECLHSIIKNDFGIIAFSNGRGENILYFLRHIIEIDPLPNDKWKVKEENLKTKEITEHTFDSVMICIGNYSVPKYPNIPGANDLGDKVIHSHNFRKGDPYKGKRVLIIGAGPSGTDIARILGEIAEKVYLSYGQTLFYRTSESVVHKPLVTSFKKNKAVFTDGTEEEIDNVIYCTGYQYSYPFLTHKCKIKIENNWVKHLYKHVVNVEYPTMGFIGITFKVCPFPTFDIQIRFFLELLKNPSRFTKEEMMADVLKDVEKRKANSFPEHHIHKIGVTLHRVYFEDLADTVKIKRVRPVVHKLYEYLCNTRDNTKRYKFINDEEFIEVTV